MSFVWIAHVASTLFMTGVIWFVQVVHYPLFARTEVEGFAAFELEHSRRTGWVVAPAMLVELGTALWLAAMPAWSGLSPSEISPGPRVWLGIGLLLLLGVWASTFFLQVPAHRVLSVRFDPGVHRRLVQTNWIRTCLWTIRAALVLWLIMKACGA